MIMNTKEVKQLEEEGFCGFKTVAELRENINVVPDYNGVYVLLRPNDDKPVFLQKGTGGTHKGKNPNVTISKLETKWNNNSSIVYIGATERGLKIRLGEYMRFGQGDTVGHWGGRYIWQLGDAADLIVCWKRVDDNAEQVEKQMIKAFKVEHGKYPFANLRL